MRKFKLIALTLFSWVSVGFLPSAVAAPKDLLKQVEALYSKSKTVEADFDQVTEVASLQTKKTSSGRLWLKKPDKLRWQTNLPDPNLLVSDGKTFWFYTPPFDASERGQLIVKKTSQVQSKLLNTLLAGEFSKMKNVRIEEKGNDRFILYPAAGTAGDVQNAEISIDLKKKTVQKVVLTHSSGNRTEVKLSQIQMAKSQGDELFRFVPPPNTDRVTEF